MGQGQLSLVNLAPPHSPNQEVQRPKAFGFAMKLFPRQNSPLYVRQNLGNLGLVLAQQTVPKKAVCRQKPCPGHLAAHFGTLAVSSSPQEGYLGAEGQLRAPSGQDDAMALGPLQNQRIIKVGKDL